MEHFFFMQKRPFDDTRGMIQYQINHFQLFGLTVAIAGAGNQQRTEELILMINRKGGNLCGCMKAVRHQWRSERIFFDKGDTIQPAQDGKDGIEGLFVKRPEFSFGKNKKRFPIKSGMTEF